MTFPRRARRAATGLVALAVLLAAGAPARAQGSPSLAERQYRAARDLERDGQVQQARQAYRQMLEGEPAGPHAADALLGLARLAWNVTSPAQLGRTAAPPAALDEARQALEQVTTKFRTASAAPEALWRLALLRLEPQNPAFDLEAARAALVSLPVLYPAAREVPEALALGARLELEAGRAARARALAFQLLADHPVHAAALEGWIVLAQAEASAGRYEPALAALGSARRSAGSDAAAAARIAALGRLVDRLAFAGGRGARPFTPSAGPVLAGRATDMVFDPEGRLLAALPGENLLVTVPAGGGAPQTRATIRTAALAIDRWGRTWTGGATVLSGPSGTGPFAVPEKTDIEGVAPTAANAAWIVDGRARRVLRLGGGGAPVTVRLPERALPRAAVADGRGGVWVLEGRGRALLHAGPDGAIVATLPLGPTVEEPVDLAADGLGNLYVLNQDPAAVLVFSPEGRPLINQPLLEEGDLGIGRADALAVDAAGNVAVFDGRRKRVLWLR